MDSTHLPSSSISSSCLLSFMLSDWWPECRNAESDADRSLPILMCQDNFAQTFTTLSIGPLHPAICDCQLVKLGGVL